MSRQRSLQNGRNGESDQSISRRQVGHLTRVAHIRAVPWGSYVQLLSMKGTSTSDCVGRVASPCQCRNRTLQR